MSALYGFYYYYSSFLYCIVTHCLAPPPLFFSVSLLNLAAALREIAPHHPDPHIMELEKLVVELRDGTPKDL
eukprot:m.33361 g.33361  ORF g.33361 m.33361 type:complete len:72 (+) comp6446_c0_seq1:617-832(+)